MLKNQTFVKSILASLLVASLVACSKKNDATPSQPYDTGVLVLNQGNFMSNNGSISLLAKDSKNISYDIFQKENARTLSGGVIDYTETNDVGIILVDNSSAGNDNIEIVNAHTFKSIATVTGVENPRHIIAVSTTKVYITCWDALNADYSYKPGYVAVLDLTQNKITKKIAVQNGAEDIVMIGGEVFVGNIYTGISKLTVIDPVQDAIKTTVEVGADPNSFVVDANQKLWLATENQVVRLNPSTKTIEAKIKVGTNLLKSPANLTLNKNKTTIFFTDYYFDSGEVYSFNITDTSIPANKILINRVFNGLGYDPTLDIIYGSYLKSYVQAGYVFRYQSNGTLIDSVKAEIAPSKFFFK